MQTPLITSILGYELLFFIIMNIFWICLYYLFKNRTSTLVSTDDKNPLISIIIPVFNKGKFITRTIDSVLSIDYAKKEIIVVDDGSTDESTEICKKYAKKGLIKLISYKDNKGKAHALNIGIKKSSGKFILTVDGDTIIDKECLKRMIRHFDNKEVGAVAGVVKIKNKKGILCGFQIIEYLQQAFQRLIQAFWSAVLVLPGPISLYSKEAIINAGYFEGDTLVEDWDITMKIHKKGYKVVSERNAKAFTFAPDKFREWWHQRIRWCRGGIKIAKKHTDIISKSDNKALTRLIFPLHIMWMIVPFIVIPTMIIIMVPTEAIMIKLAADFTIFLGALKGLLTLGAVNIVDIYAILDQMIIDFVDLGNLDWVRSSGYLSGLAFLSFTYKSIKTFENEFKPKHLLGVILMPIYWLMLNAVYIYSLLIEIFKSKEKWW